MSDISKARVKGVVYDIKDASSRSLVEQHELAIQEILENYARMDGYYETMGVGVATNLKGSNTSVSKFVYRKSGGSESVDSGLAQLTSMRGKSVIWHQLVKNGDFNGNIQNWSAFTPSNLSVAYGSRSLIATAIRSGYGFSFGVQQLLPAFDTTHIYLARAWVKSSVQQTFGWELGSGTGSNTTVPANVWSKIYTIAQGKTREVLFIIKPNEKNTPMSVGDTYELKDVCVFDLTLMFGAGNEPSTVEEFEAMFPNDYYPYNTGSLLNFNAESLKTVGFNQWDEQWENGMYNPDTGKKEDLSAIRSKNFIRILPNTQYYLRGAGERGIYAVFYYDADKNFISSVLEVPNTITTPSNACYMTFRCYVGYGITYNHDICINLSDPSKNGTYEPYWESNLPLNINTQTGKLNGSGDSVIVFPNGMAGMNGVQDTIIDNVATKKFNQINDLTTLPITLNYEGYAPEEEGGDTVYSFILELPKNGKAFTSAVMNGLFNKKYSASYGISAASSNNFYIYNLEGKSYVEIMDDDFSTDARFADEEEWDALIADIRASLADKVLMYELLSYEEYALDGIELPLNYKVDKNGTEQIVPNTTDPDNNIPSTTPCDMDIVYSIDASGTIINLPNNYVSATQQQSFSASQQAQARENIGLSNVATKYKTTIQGDGNNEYTITHNLSSTSVFVVVQDASTLEQISGYQVIADSENQITIGFNEEIGVGVTYNILILS